jgi:hypothetical protein
MDKQELLRDVYRFAGPFFIVEGYGDYTQGLDKCECVRVVRRAVTKADAVEYAAEHYEIAIGEDSDGFRMTEDNRQRFFTLVRDSITPAELGIKNEYGIAELDRDAEALSYYRLLDLGHSIYDGEACAVTGDPTTCDKCALLADYFG